MCTRIDKKDSLFYRYGRRRKIASHRYRPNPIPASNHRRITLHDGPCRTQTYVPSGRAGHYDNCRICDALCIASCERVHGRRVDTVCVGLYMPMMDIASRH